MFALVAVACAVVGVAAPAHAAVVVDEPWRYTDSTGGNASIVLWRAVTGALYLPLPATPSASTVATMGLDNPVTVANSSASVANAFTAVSVNASNYSSSLVSYYYGVRLLTANGSDPPSLPGPLYAALDDNAFAATYGMPIPTSGNAITAVPFGVAWGCGGPARGWIDLTGTPFSLPWNEAPFASAGAWGSASVTAQTAALAGAGPCGFVCPRQTNGTSFTPPQQLLQLPLLSPPVECGPLPLAPPPNFAPLPPPPPSATTTVPATTSRTPSSTRSMLRTPTQSATLPALWIGVGGAVFSATAGHLPMVLTSGAQVEQASAAWHAAPVAIRAFTWTSEVQLNADADCCADGAAFTLQTVGTAALGLGGRGLGYAGIAPSIAVRLDTAATAPASTLGLVTGGNVSTPLGELVSAQLFWKGPLTVTLSYTGAPAHNLSCTLQQAVSVVSSVTQRFTWTVDIRAALGCDADAASPCWAWFGVTAATDTTLTEWLQLAASTWQDLSPSPSPTATPASTVSSSSTATATTSPAQTAAASSTASPSSTATATPLLITRLTLGGAPSAGLLRAVGAAAFYSFQQPPAGGVSLALDVGTGDASLAVAASPPSLSGGFVALTSNSSGGSSGAAAQVAVALNCGAASPCYGPPGSLWYLRVLSRAANTSYTLAAAAIVVVPTASESIQPSFSPDTAAAPQPGAAASQAVIVPVSATLGALALLILCAAVAVAARRRRRRRAEATAAAASGGADTDASPPTAVAAPTADRAAPSGDGWDGASKQPPARRPPTNPNPPARAPPPRALRPLALRTPIPPTAPRAPNAEAAAAAVAVPVRVNARFRDARLVAAARAAPMVRAVPVPTPTAPLSSPPGPQPALSPRAPAAARLQTGRPRAPPPPVAVPPPRDVRGGAATPRAAFAPLAPGPPAPGLS